MVQAHLEIKPFICINCGNKVRELYKKSSPGVIKITKCEKCQQTADKYIEFETIIILIDSMLLSQPAYRHILYNADFKLHWKLSLVLLLLESFALWRQKLSQPVLSNVTDDFIREKGFYICCFYNIIDNLLLFFLLELFSITLYCLKKTDVFPLKSKPILELVKAIVLANFGRFFMLPIMIWRDNTTELGATVHYLLVMSYYLLSFTHIYSVISEIPRIRAALIILGVFSMKQFIAKNFMLHLENYYL